MRAAWLFLCMAAAIAFAPLAVHAKPVPVPAMKTRVNDLTQTLDAADVAALRQAIATLESDSGAQLAVLIVPTTGEDSIEQYATRVFASWKLGRKDQDDGLLLLVALKDRRMRIEVGTGLEGTVTDIQAARIIDREMAPRFRGGDVAGGIGAAVRALSDLVAGPVIVPPVDPIEEPTEVYDTAPEPEPAASPGLTREGWGLIGVLLWALGVGAWYGRRSPTAAGRNTVQKARQERKKSGKRGRQIQQPELLADAIRSTARGPVKRRPDWRLTTGLLGAGPLAAAAALQSPAMVGMVMPAGMVFGIGYACARHRTAQWIFGGFALFVAALVGAWFAVGEERFWWGFLTALCAAVACLFVGLIGFLMRAAWQRSVPLFLLRFAIVAGVIGWVFSMAGPDVSTLDERWIPVGIVSFLSLLFGFMPWGNGGGGSDSGDSGWSGGGSSSSGSDSSSSSSSSSSDSGGGGSSSGGGASGSW